MINIIFKYNGVDFNEGGSYLREKDFYYFFR